MDTEVCILASRPIVYAFDYVEERAIRLQAGMDPFKDDRADAFWEYMNSANGMLR